MQLAKEASKKKRLGKFGKDPSVETSFLPDRWVEEEGRGGDEGREEDAGFEGQTTPYAWSDTYSFHSTERSPRHSLPRGVLSSATLREPQKDRESPALGEGHTLRAPLRGLGAGGSR